MLMRDQPTGDQLLETARSILREELLPALPAEKRHAASMIANAMGIAIRQLLHGDAADQAELDALRRILSLSAADGEAHGPELRPLLIDGNRRLAEWIRLGRADEGPLHRAVREHLFKVTWQKVAESNPKYLAAPG